MIDTRQTFKSKLVESKCMGTDMWTQSGKGTGDELREWHWQLCTQFSSVQSLSRVRLFATPWITARQASLSITNSRSSLRLTSIGSVMPSSHLTTCEIHGEWAPAVEHRELSVALCDHVEGWYSGWARREAQDGGDICTRVADSLCCMEEANTTL